jgi:anhydro-N-acetylmuramic acid kinase
VPSSETSTFTADPPAALLALRALPARRVVGLMSGTSADGTDAALCEIAGAGEATKVRLLSRLTIPFGRDLRERIYALADADASELCEVNVLLGESFADAVVAVCSAAGVEPRDVHLVGSHGQTAAHRPRSAGRIGATLQIGEAAVISERTGLPVVCDFRVRDVAAGGEGAPLVPLVDHLLFRVPGIRRAIQNIGGIANVTLVGQVFADLVAFDTGPGNMALDAVARAASRGVESYDVDGKRAARGQIDATLLTELHRHPFFAQSPPKTTGRDLFGRSFVYPLLDRFAKRAPSSPGLSPLDDLLATLTRFTAETIARAYREHLPATPDEIYLCGGGAANPTLRRHLEELCAPTPVRDTGALGIEPKAKEAVSFAVLANEALFGHGGNVPHVTGARGPRVLGKISF